MALVMSFDWKGAKLGAVNWNLQSGGWPALASAVYSVTKTVTPEKRAGVWFTTKYWISDFFDGSSWIRKPVTSMAFASGEALTLETSGAGATGAAGVVVEIAADGFASAVGRTTVITLVKPAPSNVPRINAVAIQPGIKRFLDRRKSGGMERNSRSVNFTNRRVSMGPGRVARGPHSFLSN